MTRGKAEDAGGLTPAKDDNAAPYHFDRRTLPIFKCVDYTPNFLPGLLREENRGISILLIDRIHFCNIQFFNHDLPICFQREPL